MNYTAKLILKNGVYFVPRCSVLRILNNNCKLKELTADRDAMLVIIDHKKVQVLLDVSEIENYLFLSFDKHKKYTGTTCCNTAADRSFIIASQAHYAIFIPMENLPIHPSEIVALQTEYNTTRNYFIDNEE